MYIIIDQEYYLWKEEIKKAQELNIQMQEEQLDLEYRTVNKKKEFYRLWRTE